MTDPEFPMKVIARLDPMLTPRGFPCQRSSANTDGVLFHCDGPGVNEVAARYPTWFARVRGSYGSQPVTCLDLWVQQDERHRWVSFETVDADDLAAAAGVQAVERMQALAADPLDAWLDQVALVLEAYFDRIEEGAATDG